MLGLMVGTLFFVLALFGGWTIYLYQRDVRFYGIQWADDDQLYAGLVVSGIGLTGLLVVLLQL